VQIARPPAHDWISSIPKAYVSAIETLVPKSVVTPAAVDLDALNASGKVARTCDIGRRDLAESQPTRCFSRITDSPNPPAETPGTPLQAARSSSTRRQCTQTVSGTPERREEVA
jgi:hypothetical protein